MADTEVIKESKSDVCTPQFFSVTERLPELHLRPMGKNTKQSRPCLVYLEPEGFAIAIYYSTPDVHGTNQFGWIDVAHAENIIGDVVEQWAEVDLSTSVQASELYTELASAIDESA